MFGHTHSYETQQKLTLVSTMMESGGHWYGGGGQSHDVLLQSTITFGCGLEQMLLESATKKGIHLEYILEVVYFKRASP